MLSIINVRMPHVSYNPMYKSIKPFDEGTRVMLTSMLAYTNMSCCVIILSWFPLHLMFLVIIIKKKMWCRINSTDSFDRYFLSAFIHVCNMHTACATFLKESQLSAAASILKINYMRNGTQRTCSGYSCKCTYLFLTSAPTIF